MGSYTTFHHTGRNSRIDTSVTHRPPRLITKGAEKRKSAVQPGAECQILNSRPAVHELNLRRTATLFGEVVDDRLEFVEASEGGVAIKCG